MYTCPHTGVALGALVKLVERGEIKSSERVVVISTVPGLKFTGFKLATTRVSWTRWRVNWKTYPVICLQMRK